MGYDQSRDLADKLAKKAQSVAGLLMCMDFGLAGRNRDPVNQRRVFHSLLELVSRGKWAENEPPQIDEGRIAVRIPYSTFRDTIAATIGKEPTKIPALRAERPARAVQKLFKRISTNEKVTQRGIELQCSGNQVRLLLPLTGMEGEECSAWVKGYLDRLETEIADEVVHSSEQTLDIRHTYNINFTAAHSHSIGLGRRNESAVELHNFLQDARDRVVVLSGKAGAGKSTSLRYLAWEACREHRGGNGPLPLPIKCSDKLFRRLAARLGMDKAKDVKRTIKEKECIFFLDAFDDVGTEQRPQFLEALRDLRLLSPTSRFVIASRDTESPGIEGAKVFIACAPKNPEEYLECHGVDTETAAKTIKRLREMNALDVLSTPMLLWFVALLLRQAQEHKAKVKMPPVPGALMKTVVEEYFIPKMLEKPYVQHRGFSRTSIPHIAGTLGFLSHKMIQDNDGEGFDQDTTEMAFAEFFETERNWSKPGEPAHKLVEAVTYQSFLETTPDGTYTFSHNMFRDYFAACHIENHWGDKERGCTAEHLVEWMKWDNVLVLLCGMAKPAVQEACIQIAVDTDLSLATKLFQASSDAITKSNCHDLILDGIVPMCADGVELVAGALELLAKLQSTGAVALMMTMLDEAHDAMIEGRRQGLDQVVSEAAVLAFHVVCQLIARRVPWSLIDREILEKWRFQFEPEEFNNVVEFMLCKARDNKLSTNWKQKHTAAKLRDYDVLGWHRTKATSGDQNVMGDIRRDIRKMIATFENLLPQLGTATEIEYEPLYAHESRRVTKLCSLLTDASRNARKTSVVGIATALSQLRAILARAARLEKGEMLKEYIEWCRRIGTSWAKALTLHCLVEVFRVSGRRFRTIVPPQITPETVSACALVAIELSLSSNRDASQSNR